VTLDDLPPDDLPPDLRAMQLLLTVSPRAALAAIGWVRARIESEAKSAAHMGRAIYAAATLVARYGWPLRPTDVLVSP
jgi:hypothetical protein